jgi:hypothetical protein
LQDLGTYLTTLHIAQLPNCSLLTPPLAIYNGWHPDTY